MQSSPLSLCCVNGNINVNGGKNTRERYWTQDEDEILLDYIKKHGEGCWPTVARLSGLSRCYQSIRFRWMTYLRPDVKRGKVTQDEEDRIIQLHRDYGNRWSEIAQHLLERTDNMIKNYWNNHLSKKLKSQGICPITHQPLNPPDSSAHHNRANLDRSQAAETVDLGNLDIDFDHCIEFPMGCGVENCHNFYCFQQK